MWIDGWYRDGVPLSDIAEHEGCSVARIRHIIQRRKSTENWHLRADMRSMLADEKASARKEEDRKMTLSNLRIIAQGLFVLSAVLPPFNPSPES